MPAAVQETTPAPASVQTPETCGNQSLKTTIRTFFILLFPRYFDTITVVAFRHERPKWDQNLRFIPLSGTASIFFIWESPLGDGRSKAVTFWTVAELQYNGGNLTNSGVSNSCEINVIKKALIGWIEIEFTICLEFWKIKYSTFWRYVDVLEPSWQINMNITSYHYPDRRRLTK